MKSLVSGVAGLCTFAVIIAVVLLLLPQNRLAETVRLGSRMLLIVLAFPVAVSVVEYDWGSLIPNETVTVSDAQDYVSTRLAQPLCDAVEADVAEILSQFGISGGQIRIDCKKGAFGDVELEHIGVYLPKQYESKREQVKRLLLKRFDVFCDVSVGESADDSG